MRKVGRSGEVLDNKTRLLQDAPERGIQNVIDFTQQAHLL